MCVAETVRALIETWQPGIIDTGGGGGGGGVCGRISVVTLQIQPVPILGFVLFLWSSLNGS